jgi:ABC-type transport system involved in cytochrome c biogenesis ATPase subunit
VWTKLIVKNFKSIGEKGIDLDLKPLTILVGPNGSGKSSILQSIAIMSANVSQSEFLINGELIQFSTPEDIAHKHELDRWMKLEICDSKINGIRLEYKPDSGEQKETVIFKGSDYIQISMEGDRQKGLQLMVTIPGQHSAGPGISFIKLDGRVFHQPLPKEIDDSIKNTKAEIVKIIDIIGKELREKVFLISSLRGKIPIMGTSEQIPRWVGTEGQGLLPLIALISNTTLYEEAWTKIQNQAVLFGLLKLKAGYRGQGQLGADYLDPDLKSSMNLVFAGQGSRQIMSVITQLFWSSPGSLIMIEEPEMSLHPEAQYELGALFADAIKDGKQIMVTSHSHFLLLALNKAVEKGLKAKDIAVYHVTKDADGTNVQPVKLSSRGFPLGWPSSYEKVEKELARNWVKGLSEK